MGKILIYSAEEKIRESLKFILEEKYEMILVDSLDECVYTLQHITDVTALLFDLKDFQNIEKVNNYHKKLAIIGIESGKQKEESVRGLVGVLQKPFKVDEIFFLLETL